ncbi:MAG: sulfatase-like hydrolase/transferase [Bacteroidia bacterium]|nr:sulfatase-like hydrolase/transferase [Bacteroidia bacterium]
MKKLLSVGKLTAGLAMLSINTGPGVTNDNQPKLPAKNGEQPNFVFILVDDMAWYSTAVPMDTGLPASGMAFCSMPNVQKLAEQGMIFSNARAAAGMCRPSRCSISIVTESGRF